MIPHADILAWRYEHTWVTDAQVEQDLIISRAMVDLFSHPTLDGLLAMRGGTAFHAVFLTPIYGSPCQAMMWIPSRWSISSADTRAA